MKLENVFGYELQVSMHLHWRCTLVQWFFVHQGLPRLSLTGISTIKDCSCPEPGEGLLGRQMKLSYSFADESSFNFKDCLSGVFIPGCVPGTESPIVDDRFDIRIPNSFYIYKMRKSITLLIIQFTFLLSTFSQVTKKDFDFLSKYYNDQYKKLIRVRGIDTSTYFSSEYLKQNDPSKISGVINKYFGNSKAKIAALIYFYVDSTFFVFLADKFNVKQLSERKISLADITGLNNKMISSLTFKGEINNRAPRQRGAVLTSDDEEIDFTDINNFASTLLIPDPVILSYDHLIIVPCMNLGAFPFYLLRHKDKYLVDHLSYSIAPSLIEVEASCRKNEARQGSTGLGRKVKYAFERPLLVANPKYPTKTKFIFPDLPGAKTEIEGSLKFFADVPYKYYAGATATKQNVLRDFKTHDLIYFATHGISSSSNPLDSCFLVLGGEKNAFFTNREILKYFDSATKMELVILSACQTGLGKSMDAGIIGLSRAFQIAGANHVVMSLWNVDDDATAFLMQRFLMYIQLEHKFFPAEPLRKAILATKQKYPDPSRWASFAVFGVPY